MKKGIFKPKLIVATLALSGICLSSALRDYVPNSNSTQSLLLANVEALTDGNDNGEQKYVRREMTVTTYEYDEQGRIKEQRTSKTYCCEPSQYGGVCNYPPCS